MCNYNVYLLPFLRHSTSNNGVILNVGLGIIENGTIRKLWHGFLFALLSNWLYLQPFRHNART